MEDSLRVACVFCGNKPESKNKEHIFPQWLLKMTGFDKKNCSVGSNWAKEEELVINTLSYTFPACKVCNDRFSRVESKVKYIVELIADDKDVTASDLEILLDWFDKVRIGAWLGVQYMNKGYFDLEPKYYINCRVGIKDRMLSITNTYRNEKTLNWSGVNTLLFIFSPTAFTLRVNNLVFVNCSSDFVVSESLGFPYILAERLNPYSIKNDIILGEGTKKVSPNLFKTKLYSPSVVISQPIFGIIRNEASTYYENEYVRNNSYDYENGIGKIFVTRDGGIKTIERNEAINFSMPDAKLVYGNVEVVRPILELQIELIKNRRRDLSLLNPEQRENELLGTKHLIQYAEQQMQRYRY